MLKTTTAIVLGLSLFSASAAEHRFEFRPFENPDDGRIVVPAVEGEELSGFAARFDRQLNGALSVAAEEAGFTGEAGTSVTLYGVAPYPRIDLIGIGAGRANRAIAEDFGGTAAALLAETSGGVVQILWPDAIATPQATAAHVALGFRLRSYRFDRHQAEKLDTESLPAIHLLSDDNSGGRFSNDLTYVADGVFFARDMSSEPANLLYPQEFVNRARAEFRGLSNVDIRVLDEDDLQRLNMGAHYSVGKGSARPPRLLIIEYMAGGQDAPVVLAGKGVTFDTGGISIKPAPGMGDMKWDMGGAGAVTGAMAAIAGRKAKANVVGVIGLVENMPDGKAQRPGDVVKSMSGQTIEVLNTDAEGRLVLADALWWTQETYKPETVIDLATLTGAIIISLAHEFGGMFTQDDKLAKKLTEAGETTGDLLWRMPLTKAHDDMIKSDIADMQNIGGKGAGSSTAAAFLGRFIKDGVSWAHLDIAGMAWNDKDKPTIPKGGSGYGVRLLDEFVRSNFE